MAERMRSTDEARRSAGHGRPWGWTAVIGVVALVALVGAAAWALLGDDDGGSRELVDRMVTAWNEDDVDALTELYDPDVVMVTATGITLEGRDRVLDWGGWAEAFGAPDMEVSGEVLESGELVAFRTTSPFDGLVVARLVDGRVVLVHAFDGR